MNLDKIAAVKTGRYPLYADEIIGLLRSTEGNAFVAMHLAYNYGFARGRNAEKRNARKQKGGERT